MQQHGTAGTQAGGGPHPHKVIPRRPRPSDAQSPRPPDPPAAESPRAEGIQVSTVEIVDIIHSL